jgi:transcriptional regulator with XRE-family HTH domain
LFVGKLAFSEQDRIFVAAQMRAARIRAGLTQEELAAALGKTQSYIAKWETRERRMQLFEVLEFCAALQVRLEDLLPAELRPLLTDYGRRRA